MSSTKVSIYEGRRTHPMASATPTHHAYKTHFNIKVESHNILSDSKIKCMCLLLSGDVHQCPGPATRERQARFPCTCCGKGVRSNSRAISCDQCERWTHIACCDYPADRYERLISEGIEESFVCPSCCLSALPGWLDDDNEPNVDSSAGDIETTTDHATENENESEEDEWVCMGRKGLHILH